MERFQEKYRISSTRLRNWDYAALGMYFVTSCTKNREHYFGQIIKSVIHKGHFEMQLSEIGKIVESEWVRTPEIRQDMNLEIGDFQVMPNHFHAILIIGDNPFNSPETIHNTDKNPVDPRRDAMLASLIYSDSDSDSDSNPNPSDTDSKPDDKPISKPQSNSDYHSIFELESQMFLGTNSRGKNKFGPQSKNLASIMRGFKSSVTSLMKDQNVNFNWQPRYYDHIIRDHEEYQRIANYIRNNPDNWGNDRLR
jgi:REP element-mobilizing transposase RayT